MLKNEQCENRTDKELVILVLKNQDYFLCLMERYEGRLLRYIRRISNVSVEEAEDVLQEVFIKVYQNLNNFDLSLKFSSWIYRITHNQVISNYRKNKNRPQTVFLDQNDSFLENLAFDLDLDKEIDLRDFQNKIRQILEGLDIKYREVLMLKFLEEKDYKEISDILRKPMGTVGTLINRAKKQLKNELLKQKIEL